VMARRPHCAECIFHAARHHRIDRVQHSTSREVGHVERIPGNQRVSRAELFQPLHGRQFAASQLEVGAVMDERQVVFSCPTRHNSKEGFQQAGVLQAIPNGRQSLGPFRVASISSQVSEIHIIKEQPRLPRCGC
jgi:hypothetical protein